MSNTSIGVSVNSIANPNPLFLNNPQLTRSALKHGNLQTNVH